MPKKGKGEGGSEIPPCPAQGGGPRVGDNPDPPSKVLRVNSTSSHITRQRKRRKKKAPPPHPRCLVPGFGTLNWAFQARAEHAGGTRAGRGHTGLWEHAGGHGSNFADTAGGCVGCVRSGFFSFPSFFLKPYGRLICSEVFQLPQRGC